MARILRCECGMAFKSLAAYEKHIKKDHLRKGPEYHTEGLVM